MIKCDCKIIGTVVTVPVSRPDRNSVMCLWFEIDVGLPNESKTTQLKRISVMLPSHNQGDIVLLVSQKVEIQGALYIRKRHGDEVLFVNATSVRIIENTLQDQISGMAHIDGTIGRDVLEKVDKKGGLYVTGFVYTSEKVDGDYEYLWTRIIGFGMSKAEWMQKGARVFVTGQIELSFFQGRLSLSCRLSELIFKGVSPAN